MENTTKKIEVTKKEKKGLGGWIRKHRVGIVKTVTVIGGLTLLNLTYNKGREVGYNKGTKEMLDIADKVEQDLLMKDFVEEEI